MLFVTHHIIHYLLYSIFVRSRQSVHWKPSRMRWKQRVWSIATLSMVLHSANTLPGWRTLCRRANMSMKSLVLRNWKNSGSKYRSKWMTPSHSWFIHVLVGNYRISKVWASRQSAALVRMARSFIMIQARRQNFQLPPTICIYAILVHNSCELNDQHTPTNTQTNVFWDDSNFPIARFLYTTAMVQQMLLGPGISEHQHHIKSSVSRACWRVKSHWPPLCFRTKPKWAHDKIRNY